MPERRRTKLEPKQELEFRLWYKDHAETWGLDPDPDDPLHKYDYRAAFLAGFSPDEEGHWPSIFKDKDHPNRFVGGVDTITGYPTSRESTMPEMPFNPNVRGGMGPARSSGLNDDVLALLQLLAQSGAGPAADALSQGNPSEDELLSLIRQLTGSMPGAGDRRGALRSLERREAAPAVEPQMPSNLGESRISALLQKLLTG